MTAGRRRDPESARFALAHHARTAGGAALLHLEDIREVGFEQDLHAHDHRLAREAAQRHLLAQPVPDAPVPLHDQRGVGAAGDVPRATDHHDVVRVGRHRRERFHRRAVDEDGETRDDPGVPVECAVRQVWRHVAIRRRDAEGSSLDDRHGAGSGRVRECVRVPTGHVTASGPDGAAPSVRRAPRIRRRLTVGRPPERGQGLDHVGAVCYSALARGRPGGRASALT